MKKLLLLSLLSLSFLGNAQTRTGILMTAEETTIWIDRWANGPFASQNDAPIFPVSVNGVNGGDGQKNTPADKARILANANSFRTSQTSDYYGNTVYAGTGQVPKSSKYPEGKGDGLRDAGFVFLMTGDTTYSRPVRLQLLKTVRDPLFDFTNTVRWTPGYLNDIGPGFAIAQWVTRLLFGYDYAKGDPNMTAGQKIEIDQWFLEAANYLRTNYDNNINNYFTNRSTLPVGPYTIKSLNEEINGSKSLLYKKADGTKGISAHKVERVFNNRHSATAGGVGLIGVYLNNQTLTNSALKFYKDFIIYGLYPNGVTVDYLRAEVSKPELGFEYAKLHEMWVFADAMARRGNTELYDFTTTAGTTTAMVGSDASTDGTTVKSLLMFLEQTAQRRNHTNTAIYNPDGTVINSTTLIDGVFGNNYTYWDIIFSLPSNYYKRRDGYLLAYQTYTRTATGTGVIPLANVLQKSGSTDVFTLGELPGTLFQHGLMEDLVNPYPTLQGGTPKTNQVITINTIPSKTYGDAPFPVTASASSGLAVTLTSLNTSVFTVSGSTITIVGAGTGTLRATQAGDATYNPAGATDLNITISKQPQLLTFTTPADAETTDSPITLTATASSGLTVAYDVTSGPATVSGSTLTLDGVIGVVTVAATQAGNANIAAAPTISRSFQVLATAPPAEAELLTGVSEVDTNRYVSDENGYPVLESTRWYVLPSTQTGYNIRKVGIPSGNGIPQNALKEVKLYIRDGSGVVTQVATLDATGQPSFEKSLDFTGNVKAVFFRSLGSNITARVPKGSTGMKIRGL